MTVADELAAARIEGGGNGCLIIVSRGVWLSREAGLWLMRAAAWLGYDEARHWSSVADAIADGRWQELQSAAIALFIEQSIVDAFEARKLTPLMQGTEEDHESAQPE